MNKALSGYIPVGILLIAFCIAGCPRNIPNESIDKQARVLIYERNCAYCHGNRGEVETNSVYLNKSDMDEDQIIEVTRDGVGTMPGFEEKLTEKEIEAVSNYVYEFIIREFEALESGD